MSTLRETLLCEYVYDPLDRLVSQKQKNIPAKKYFYKEGLLATEIKGGVGRSVMQHRNLPLAEQLNQEDGGTISLLATDQRRSVMHAMTAIKQAATYSPYGFCIESGLTSLLGFNGERSDSVTGHYLLGNGYRAFNPVLMRFNSPDSWSPFGQGGLNSYAYCLCDPINLIDQNGHSPFKVFIRFFKKLSRSKKTATNSSSIQRAPIFNNGTPKRRHSSPSLLSASPSEDQLTYWDKIGDHGTSSNYTDSLEAGLDPRFMGKSNNMLLGEGFYFGTQDFAEDFAYGVANPYGPAGSIFGKPKVFSVYTENFARLKPGEDYLVSRSVNIYRRNPNGKFGAWNYREVVAKEHIYKNLVIRSAGYNRKVVSPSPYETPLSSRAAANVEGVRSLFFNKTFR